MTILFGFTFFDFTSVLAEEINRNQVSLALVGQDEDENLEAYLSENSFIYAIENIPDSILDNPEAIVKWFQQHAGEDYQFTTDGENLLIDTTSADTFLLMDMPYSDSEYQTFGIGACIGAIGAALVTGILPIAKITKIKNALKAVGGTSKFVNNLIAHYKFNRNKGWSRSRSYDDAFDRATAAYGSQIKTELGALFGITAVYGACFE
jgi:hypothetical protein